MGEWVCLNGRLMPADEARVSVFDSGFMQGIGLFETMRAYRGSVFRLQRHLDRLAASARALGWSIIPEPEELHEHVTQVLAAMGEQDARVRLTVTTGSLRPAENPEPRLTIVASASPGGKYPDEYYAQGAAVMVSKWRQSRLDPTVGHKTTSYFARLASLREAHISGVFEALWLSDEGHVAEGTISSLFLVADGELRTPPLSTPILPGITRATVIELAAAMNIPVHEVDMTLAEVQSADEVFLTNSMMEIMPVVRVDQPDVGTAKPGELTRRLAGAYAELVSRECGHG